MEADVRPRIAHGPCVEGHDLDAGFPGGVPVRRVQLGDLPDRVMRLHSAQPPPPAQHHGTAFKKEHGVCLRLRWLLCANHYACGCVCSCSGGGGRHADLRGREAVDLVAGLRRCQVLQEYQRPAASAQTINVVLSAHSLLYWATKVISCPSVHNQPPQHWLFPRLCCASSCSM